MFLENIFGNEQMLVSTEALHQKSNTFDLLNDEVHCKKKSSTLTIFIIL